MPRSRYGTKRVRDAPNAERNVDNTDLSEKISSVSIGLSSNTSNTMFQDIIVNSNSGLSAYAETEELKRQLRVLEDKLRLENLGASALFQIEDLKRNLSELEEKVRHIESVAVNSLRNDGHPQFFNVRTTTIQKTIVSKSSDHTVVAGEGSVYIGNAAGGTVTFTLPATATCVGLVLTFKKQDSSGNNVVIDGNASEAIDGATTKSLGTQFHSITIIANGTGWSIIGELD